MNVAEEFEAALKEGLSRLSEDEWAITKVRELILEPLSSHECFSGIAGVLEVASRQADPYCFSSCCWFALDLARKADTSEFPAEANKYLLNRTGFRGGLNS